MTSGPGREGEVVECSDEAKIRFEKVVNSYAVHAWHLTRYIRSYFVSSR